MQYPAFRLRTIVMMVAAICSAPQLALAENKAEVLETGTIDVVSEKTQTVAERRSEGAKQHAASTI